MKRINATVLVFAVAIAVPPTPGHCEEELQTTARLTTSANDSRGCTPVGKVKGKGSTEAWAKASLRRNAWLRRADLVHLTGKTKKGLRGNAYRCREVRITSNPEVVHGCKFVENIEIYNSFSAMLGTNNPVKASDLANKAWSTGADTIIVIDTGNNSGSAEAYYCGERSEEDLE